MPELLKKHFIFWMLPSAYCLLIMALYFSGNHALIDWVTPRTMTYPWSDYGDRELGLLENAQHLLILGCIFVLIKGWPSLVHWLQKLGVGVALLVLTFMFCEEIDYGTHYWDFITGAAQFEGDVNYHNTSKNTNRMKQIADLGMVIWLVILPLIAARSKNPWLRYFAPTRMFFFTVIAAVCVSKFAHYLDDAGYAIRHSLSNNISEYRELFTYYTWLLYCVVMVRQTWPGKAGDTGQDAEAA
ncbi:MAG: hypothetical protein ACPHER_07405 [Nevskiales bacterium]